ncbi:MAG TPA: zinc transporter ZupT [Thermotogota bacterium]|nr:zinc transporter ZupT [Thermotogota bacterium]
MVFSFGTLFFAFALTLLAGLSTGVGGAIAFFAKKTNTRLLSIALGFSAGVMVYISFVEILPKSVETLTAEMGSIGNWIGVLAFFGGILFIALIDKLVPDYENPHEMHKVEEMGEDRHDREAQKSKRLMRMGLFSAGAIALHNLPEGLATFIAALKDPQLGIAITVAIAIHNIPEGIAVSVPIFYATGSKKKAFIYSLLSGFAEPVGAIIGFLFIYLIFGLNDLVLGVVFAIVAGIMVYISFDELLPAAEEYGEHHFSILGLIAGMAVMAFSLLILG